MMRVNLKELEADQKEIERLYYEVKLACVRAGLLPVDDDELFKFVILDKFYYDAKKWMNEFYRVAGHVYMTSVERITNVESSIRRAIRLDYTVKQFLYDLVSDWRSYATYGHPCSIYLRDPEEI